nr:uncharacterized protein LOC104096343 [Ipomoea batatas]
MKGKATQNRFLRFLALPMRCLSRTRDCYINGMNNYAVVNQPKAPSRVQRSYSVSSQGSNDSEDYRELLKAASMRGMEAPDANFPTKETAVILICRDNVVNIMYVSVSLCWKFQGYLNLFEASAQII